MNSFLCTFDYFQWLFMRKLFTFFPCVFFGIFNTFFVVHFHCFFLLLFFFFGIFTLSSFEASHVTTYPHIKWNSTRYKLNCRTNNDTQTKSENFCIGIGNGVSPSFLLCVFLFTDISTSLAGWKYVKFNNNVRNTFIQKYSNGRMNQRDAKQS